MSIYLLMFHHKLYYLEAPKNDKCKRRPVCVGGLRSVYGGKNEQVIHKIRNIFIVQTFSSASLAGLSHFFKKKKKKFGRNPKCDRDCA